ncbi:MAG: phospholipase D-like domain-containing protein [Ktedonobacterales bacterium]
MSFSSGGGVVGMKDVQQVHDWWANGDFPVRDGCRVEPLIDGRAAMLAMCRAFLGAKNYILLAGWDLRADLPMVRGGDARLGADESPQQRTLLAHLREEGLDDEAIALWRSEKLRVVDVLGFAARRGVRVGVLLWDAFHLGCHITNDPIKQREMLTSVGVDCLLDDSSRQITHMSQSLHQKCAVVDGRIGFLGGIDLTVQDGGDYDRWDTHLHPCASTERLASRSASSHPWHDVHTRIQGPAVADVVRNIVQRWSEVAMRQQGPAWPSHLSIEPPAPMSAGVRTQIVRTIPPNIYAFAPQGIATIKELYLHALAQARHFIYIENQYLWPEVFLGLDRLRWGERSKEILDVLEAIGKALARGVHLALVLPDHPNCGRRFTDGGIAFLRQYTQSPEAGQLSAFMLGSAEEDETLPGNIFYRPIYTHAKTMIVDDTWWTAGSANLNSRGMHSDAEINIGVEDPATAHWLRLRLWMEHLHRQPHDITSIADPLAGLRMMYALAEANRERVHRREPLDGHLLPYLTADEGKVLGLNVHPEHGWLDNIAGGVGGLGAEVADCYL